MSASGEPRVGLVLGAGGVLGGAWLYRPDLTDAGLAPMTAGPKAD